MRYSENDSGGVLWNDGNDIAALITAQLVQMQNCGRNWVDYRFGSWWRSG